MNAGTLARWLHSTGTVDYRPVEAGGTCFIGTQPASPDVCVTVVDLGGEINRVTGCATTEFQVRVRGARGDVLGPQEWARQVASAFVMLADVCPTTVAAGTPDESVVSLVVPGAPGNAGLDSEGRAEWIMRVRVIAGFPSLPSV